MYSSNDLAEKFKKKASGGDKPQNSPPASAKAKKSAQEKSGSSKGYSHAYKKRIASKLRPAHADGSPKN